jgi:tRNA-specific 2-thiouridylase
MDGITAKVRYKSPEFSVKLIVNGDSAEVIFDKPQRAIAPGQSVVFYRGDEVLGGGIIESFEPAENKPDGSQVHADIR